MTLVRYEPIRLFGRFNNEINRLLAGSMPQDDTARALRWSPAVDIREAEDRFILLADLPGVAREAIDISLEDGILTIKGERVTLDADQAESCRRRERRQGSFQRQFSLPETVDTESISATMKDGVLQVEIPKHSKPQARRIDVS